MTKNNEKWRKKTKNVDMMTKNDERHDEKWRKNDDVTSGGAFRLTKFVPMIGCVKFTGLTLKATCKTNRIK